MVSCDVMLSTHKDGISLMDLGTTFVATIVDARDFIDRLEATFCNQLWPAFRAELSRSKWRVIELERDAEASSKQYAQREKLELEREQERDLLRGQDGEIRAELEHLRKLHEADGEVRKGMSEELEKHMRENHILKNKLQSLQEGNGNDENQRKNLADKVEQLQEEAKLTATKLVLLETENQELAKMRSSVGIENAIRDRRLSLKKLTKIVGRSSFVTGTDLDPQSSSTADLAVPDNANRNVNQGLDFSTSGLENKETVRGISPINTKADKIVNRAAGEDPRDIVSPPMSKTSCDSPVRLIESDETTLGLDPFSPGIPEYPVISVSSATQADTCYELLQIASPRPVEVFSPVAGEQKVQKDRIMFQIDTGQVSKPPIPPSFRTTRSTKMLSRTKEPAWRQTRHRTECCEQDQHDSFLDTPREKARAQLEIDIRKETETANSFKVPKVSAAPVVTSREGEECNEKDGAARKPHHLFGSSRLVMEASTTGRTDRDEKQGPASKAPPYKFNEPVRKKRDRELLQTTDCPQCRNFYEAVEAGDVNGMVLSDCEHHKASRHRYKNLPPPTPDGFWNIGFDDSDSSPIQSG